MRELVDINARIQLAGRGGSKAHRARLEQLLDQLSHLHLVPASTHAVIIHPGRVRLGRSDYYMPGEDNDTIRLWPCNDDLLTCLHEIGHWLDRRAFSDYDSNARCASHMRPLTDHWYAAARNSQQSELVIEREGDFPNYARYVNSTVEMFARSYAQWAAIKLGLLDQLALCANTSWRTARLGVPPQIWDEDDFEPIGRALEQLLAAQGLLIFPDTIKQAS